MTSSEFLRVFKSPLLEYIRDENNQKTGVMIAFKNGTEIRFGWSKCHTKGLPGKVDTFDRDRGIHIAFARSNKYFECVDCKVYWRMKEQFIKFMQKAYRFYTKDGSEYQFPSFFVEIPPSDGK